MTYTHLTPTELVMIEAYVTRSVPVTVIAQTLGRARQTIYKVHPFLLKGNTALDYTEHYHMNKKKCGRKPLQLPPEQQVYITQKVSKGWTPDVIIGRPEQSISCSMRTLYRQFNRGVFDTPSLPTKGKSKPNGHTETRGKQAFQRHLSDRQTDYPNFNTEFGHLEGDTIVGAHHKSAVITLFERVSKMITTLKPKGRKASDIETSITQWLSSIPRHLFKSITFDCGKEFSNLKNIRNMGIFLSILQILARPLNED